MRASYPTYKSTSIPWMPEMPEHWEQRKNKYLFRRSKSLAGKDFEKYPVLSLTMNGVIRRDLDNPMGKMPATFADYQLIQDNTLLFCLFDYDVTPRTVGMVNEKGIVSPAYTSMYPVEKINLRYYYYWFLMLDERKMLLTHVTNLRNSVSYETFAGLFSPFPPLTEQTAIANYLDAKTEQINRFIAKKEKLIALLKEQKQAVINELLEDKEGKWERRKLKYFCKVKNGFAFDANTYIQDGVQIIKIGNLYRNELCLDRDPSFVDINLFESLKDFQVKREDILISLTGTLGKRDYGYAISVNSDQKLLLNQRVAKLIPDDRLILKEYFLYALWSNDFLDQIYSKPAGTKQANLGNEMILNTYVKLPDLKNQKVVINLINKNVGRINEAIERVEKEIEKVKELKQSLIAEVVTGRIKVA